MKDSDGCRPPAPLDPRPYRMCHVWWVVVILAALTLTSCDVAATSSSTTSSTAVASTETATPAPAASTTPIAETPQPSLAPSVPPPTAGPPAATPAVTAAAALGGVAVPNPSLTPGEIFPAASTAQICRPGYSSGVRHVELSQYHAVYAEYGIAYPEPSGTYELDHLIPLELGGDNANANLWPEPASPVPGFHQKDQLENALHALVCSGQLDLGQAQRAIATDWYSAYVQYVQR